MAQNEATRDQPEQWLEEQMRRYIFDKDPKRRIWALDEYRKLKGLVPWAERHDANLATNLIDERSTSVKDNH